MVLFKEGDTEQQTIVGLHTYFTEAKQTLTDIGQFLTDNKERIFVQSKSGEQVWHRTSPYYKGRVGQAVLDLGITFRTHTQASLNKGKRVGDTVKTFRNIQSLA
eukprot:16207179-Heterocapsa_arctica.AAC.2